MKSANRRQAQPSIPPPCDRIISIREATERLGVNRATLGRWQRDGIMPPRRQLGPGRVGWLATELASWLETLPTADTQSHPQDEAHS
jgi:prophage regulatory protein